MWILFLIYEGYFGFPRMSVRGINKAKRELGFVLMALNMRKVTAQRTENILIKRQFLYYFNRNCLFIYLGTLCPNLFPTISQVLIIKISIT